MRRRPGPPSCPPDEVLLAPAGDLDEASARALEAHVAGCARCRADRESMAVLDEVLAHPDEAPPGLRARVLARADAEPARRLPERLVPGAALAAAAVAILLALAGPARERPPRPPAPAEPAARAAVPAAETAPAVEGAPAIAGPPRGADDLAALQRVARGEDAVAAREAIRRLGDLRRAESLPVLVSALAEGDRRRAAVLALGALGDERAVADLAAWLGDPDLAADARAAVTRIGGPAAARALADVAARTAPEAAGPWVRALAAVDGPVGTRALLDLARGDAYAPTVRDALRAEGSRVVPHLLDLARVRDDDLAERALLHLEALADPASVPSLADLLESRARRARAAQVLARIDTPEAASALWARAHHPEVRAAFRRGGLATEAWLLDRLERGHVRDRLLAIDLLGLSGGPASVPALEALAGDPAAAPRAIAALGRIGGAPAVEALARLAGTPGLCRLAVEALGQTGDAAAVGPLAALGAGDRALRDAAIASLARLPAPEAVAAIVGLDRGEAPRPTTLRALREIDREVLCAALLGLLEGPLAPDARRTLAAVCDPPAGTRTPVTRF